MARGSVATAIHSNERSAVIRLSAAAKEDDGDDNADDDEDRGADPNPDHRLNGQHLGPMVLSHQDDEGGEEGEEEEGQVGFLRSLQSLSK